MRIPPAFDHLVITPSRGIRTPRREGFGADFARTDHTRRLVVVSNLVAPEGPQSGSLAMTLRGVLRQHGGLWFGWSGTIDEQQQLHHGHDSRDGFDHAAFDFNQSDHDQFFHGFPNHCLSPLLQSRLQDMQFHRRDMHAWITVVNKTATRLHALLRPDDLVWINGVHLLPLARQLRALGAENAIGLFLPESLPASNALSSLPHHDSVFAGLSACDLIGVQATSDHDALRDYLVKFQSAQPGRDGTLRIAGHELSLGSFPVGIDVDRMVHLARRAGSRAMFRKFCARLGSHKLLIGVDRPDHGKGLNLRLCALDRLLEKEPQLAGKFSMLQISPPLRCDMRRYRELDRDLDCKVSDVNGKHGGAGWAPVRYLKKGFRQPVLAGYLRASSMGLMTPLHGGMNLLAREYVACQNQADPGVLVLSRFAGAAPAMTEAVLVNPLDADDVAAGILAALTMPLKERQARWQSLMAGLRHQDLQQWSHDFLQSLAGVRPTTRGTLAIGTT